jgi:hypothetical protein
MHGPTCIFWANLTPFLLGFQVTVELADLAAPEPGSAASAAAARRRPPPRPARRHELRPPATPVVDIPGGDEPYAEEDEPELVGIGSADAATHPGAAATSEDREEVRRVSALSSAMARQHLYAISTRHALVPQTASYSVWWVGLCRFRMGC